MDENTLRERKTNEKSDDNQSTNPIPESTPTLTKELSPKEVYFELLGTWVNQANICHNALACFPYYLAANYPQIFQQPVRNGVTGVGLLTQPQSPPAQQQQPPRINRNPFGNEEFIDNAVRSEESESNLVTYRMIQE